VLYQPWRQEQFISAIQSFPLLRSGRTHSKAKTLRNVNNIIDSSRCFGVTENGDLGYYC